LLDSLLQEIQDEDIEPVLFGSFEYRDCCQSVEEV